MEKYVGRSSKSQDRFFPPITQRLYSFSTTAMQTSPSHVESTALAVLELAERNFTRWQQWTGRGLDSTGQLGRLLWLHRSALDDELNGRWKRADFFWREILHTLRNMQKQRVWEQLNERFTFDGDSPPGNSIELHYRVTAEILIDTHCSLINSRLKKAEVIESGDRVLAYAAYLQKLLPLTKIGETELWSIIEPLTDVLIKFNLSQDQIQPAIKICENMASEFPRNLKYQDLLVELEVRSAFAELHDEDEGSINLTDARRLHKAVNELERLRKDYPYNPELYESLGLLKQVQAVKLANGGELSQALLVIEEALAFSPWSTQAAKIRDQLRISMQTLKAQIAEVEAEIAKEPGRTLSADGERLRNEARKGEKMADQYIESGRATTLFEEVQKAQAVRLWQLAGLGGTDEQIVRNAMELYKALAPLYNDNPEDLDSLKAKLEEVTEGIPEIDPSMRESLEVYLKGRFFPVEAYEKETPVPGVSEPFILEPNKVFEIPSQEPVGMWMLSGEAIGIKVLTVIVLAIMVFSGTIAGVEGYRRHLRDQAYEELINAAHMGEEQVVSHAAGEFLSAVGIKFDARRAQVEELPNQLTRNVAYTNLLAAINAETPELVMNAAEVFLAAAPINIVDNRHEQVVNAYCRAFVSWFVTVESPNVASVQQRIKTYSDLITDTSMRN